MFGGELKDMLEWGSKEDLRGSETRQRAVGAVQRAEGPGGPGGRKRYRGSKKEVPY